MDCYNSSRNLFNNTGNTMEKIFELKNVGAIFILFGFGMMLGIVGFVEGLTVIGYTETIEIGIRLILSMFLMLMGKRIYNGK